MCNKGLSEKALAARLRHAFLLGNTLRFLCDKAIHISKAFRREPVAMSTCGGQFGGNTEEKSEAMGLVLCLPLYENLWDKNQGKRRVEMRALYKALSKSATLAQKSPYRLQTAQPALQEDRDVAEAAPVVLRSIRQL